MIIPVRKDTYRGDKLQMKYFNKQRYQTDGHHYK